MIKYEDPKRNHVIIPGREEVLDKFLKSSYKGMSHKTKNGHSSNSEDAITWSCFDIISQLSEAKKAIALDELIEHSFCDKDMAKKEFSFSDEKNIQIEVGKTYKGLIIKEQTELDACIETSTKVIFIEAKLYSSISLSNGDSESYDQIAKKLRVGRDYSAKENKEFFFIFLDIAPRNKIYSFSDEKKSMENAKKLSPKKWKSVWWFNRYKRTPHAMKEILDNIASLQTLNSVAENMGWLTWTDLFKITMRSLV